MILKMQLMRNHEKFSPYFLYELGKGLDYRGITIFPFALKTLFPELELGPGENVSVTVEIKKVSEKRKGRFITS